MEIRRYHEQDLDQLRRIHKSQGFCYEFPDLRNPLFLSKLVLVGGAEARQCCALSRHDANGAENSDVDKSAIEEAGESGQALRGSGQALQGSGQGIVGAALLRLTAEAYLLLDPRAGTPRERWQWLLALHQATQQEAWARGLEDVHAWLPPEIAAKFGRRMTRLGWIRDDVWTPYCKRLDASTVAVHVDARL